MYDVSKLITVISVFIDSCSAFYRAADFPSFLLACLDHGRTERKAPLALKVFREIVEREVPEESLPVMKCL